MPTSEPARLPTAVNDARFALDGRHVVAVTFDDRTNTFLLTRPVTWSDASSEESVVQPELPSETERLRELRTKIAPLVGGREEILSEALSPDGRLVAVGCSDGAARLWLARTLERSVEPMFHKAKVNCVRFSPDGLRLLTSTSTGELRLWDVQTGQPLSDPTPSPRSVVWAVFSADGGCAITSAGLKFEVPCIEGNVPAWMPQLIESFAALPSSQDARTQPRPDVSSPIDETMWLHVPPTNQLVRWIKQAFE